MLISSSLTVRQGSYGGGLSGSPPVGKLTFQRGRYLRMAAVQGSSSPTTSRQTPTETTTTTTTSMNSISLLFKGGCGNMPMTFYLILKQIQERNVLFNNTLNTFYLWLYGVGHMVKDHSDSGRKPVAATTWATHQLAARSLLYAPSHRLDSTYDSLCYTSHKINSNKKN